MATSVPLRISPGPGTVFSRSVVYGQRLFTTLLYQKWQRVRSLLSFRPEELLNHGPALGCKHPADRLNPMVKDTIVEEGQTGLDHAGFFFTRSENES